MNADWQTVWKRGAKRPFDPARWPFFYGWFILFAATVGTIASVPGQTFGVSAFTEHLLEALEVNRTKLSLAYMLGTIGSAFILTWGGRLYDAIGARLTAVVSGFGLGVVVLYLARIDLVAAGISRFTDLPDAWAALAAVTAGFLLLRFMGQGMLTMVSRNMVMKWFQRRRGLANGIIGVFVPIFFSMTPIVFDRLIQEFGWRGSWNWMGAVLILFFAGFALIFYRDNPEDCELLPDGDTADEGDGEGRNHHTGGDFTLPQARRTYAFWVFNLTIALHALYMTALTFHIVSLFGDAGIGKTRAFAIFIPSSVISIMLGMFAGWISDHIRLKNLLFVLSGGMAVSIIGVFALGTGPGYYLVIAGNGIAGGTFGLLMTVTWPRFYGRTHLGAISGFHMSWVVAFSALGPFLFGLLFEHVGSYRPAAAACLGFLAVLFFCALRLKESHPKELRNGSTA